ncbi:MAG: polysaccharide biosynthesis/export family protein, partial [Desulfovibrionaceae bacterium]|nr:polysaccharide biosynthesis/export family protein [Desulfovibrionaceae bacterium]
MSKHILLTAALVPALVLLPQLPAVHAAGPQNSSGAGYGRALGPSGNPSPAGAGGIQGMPSTQPPSYLPAGYQREAIYQQQMYGQPASMQQGQNSLAGLPAWAQDRYRGDMTTGLLPYGANLFRGNFAGTYGSGMNEEYVILPGDRITVRVWGARSYDDVLFVDQQGNIFLPEVGPV